jgi:hypothetical protein
MAKKWIQKAIKRPGRVKSYLKRKYGDKAFNKDGSIKVTYINKPLKETENKSLQAALRLAKRLKRM